MTFVYGLQQIPNRKQKPANQLFLFVLKLLKLSQFHHMTAAPHKYNYLANFYLQNKIQPNPEIPRSSHSKTKLTREYVHLNLNTKNINHHDQPKPAKQQTNLNYYQRQLKYAYDYKKQTQTEKKRAVTITDETTKDYRSSQNKQMQSSNAKRIIKNSHLMTDQQILKQIKRPTLIEELSQSHFKLSKTPKKFNTLIPNDKNKSINKTTTIDKNKVYSDIHKQQSPNVPRVPIVHNHQIYLPAQYRKQKNTEQNKQQIIIHKLGGNRKSKQVIKGEAYIKKNNSPYRVAKLTAAQSQQSIQPIYVGKQLKRTNLDYLFLTQKQVRLNPSAKQPLTRHPHI